MQSGEHRGNSVDEVGVLNAVRNSLGSGRRMHQSPFNFFADPRQFFIARAIKARTLLRFIAKIKSAGFPQVRWYNATIASDEAQFMVAALQSNSSFNIYFFYVFTDAVLACAARLLAVIALRSRKTINFVEDLFFAFK